MPALAQVSPGQSSRWRVSEPEGLWAVAKVHCASRNGSRDIPNHSLTPQPKPHQVQVGSLCFLRLSLVSLLPICGLIWRFRFPSAGSPDLATGLGRESGHWGPCCGETR